MKWTTAQLAIVLAFISAMSLVPMWILAANQGEDEIVKTGAGLFFASAAGLMAYVVKRVMESGNNSR